MCLTRETLITAKNRNNGACLLNVTRITLVLKNARNIYVTENVNYFEDDFLKF